MTEARATEAVSLTSLDIAVPVSSLELSLVFVSTVLIVYICITSDFYIYI